MIKLIEIKGMELVLEVDGKNEEFPLSDLFTIDDNDLTHEFSHQVVTFGRFSILVARAEEQYSRAKFLTQQSYAEADLYIREEMSKQEKKYTETVVKSLIMQDEEYNEIREKEAGAEHLYKLLRSILHAFDQRANMLMSMGAHIRSEMEMTGMHIREKEMDTTIDVVKKTIRSRNKKQV